MQEKIGETLVRIGALKLDQLEDILRVQKAGDNRLFGEIAIESGYINDEALRRYVEAEEEWKRSITTPGVSEQKSDCKYGDTCHFFNLKTNTPSVRILKKIFCVENPQRCAIYEVKVVEKTVSTTLGPLGKLQALLQAG
jgi:hypothetical protein